MSPMACIRQLTCNSQSVRVTSARIGSNNFEGEASSGRGVCKLLLPAPVPHFSPKAYTALSTPLPIYITPFTTTGEEGNWQALQLPMG
jgi:hypothetical protein